MTDQKKKDRRGVVILYTCCVGLVACQYGLWHLMVNSVYTKPQQWNGWYVMCFVVAVAWFGAIFTHYDVRHRNYDQEKEGDSCETKQ